MAATAVPARPGGPIARIGALAPALALAFGGATAALAASDVLNPGSRLGRLLAADLPLDALGPGDLAAALGAVTLVAIALGLRREKRRSWELGVLLLGSATLSQALALRHPVGATIAGVLLGVLLLGWRRYVVPAERPGRRLLALATLGIVAAATDAVLALAVPAARLDPAIGLRTAAGALAGIASFGSVPALAWLTGHGGILAVATLAVRMPLALFAIAALRPAPAPPDAEAAAAAGAILRRDGHGALLPFQLEPDKTRLVTPDGAVVAYGRYGRTAVALGNPAGPAAAIAGAWEAFASACRAGDLVPAVYQASGDQRAALLTAGFRPFRVGQEAIIDLAMFDLAGSRRANLRHTVTRARKGGVSFRFHPGGIPAAERERLLPGLAAIDRAWAEAAGPTMGFTVGAFDLDAVDRTAIAVALDADGAPIAFTTFRPTGADGGWVLDLMRRRAGGTPGALEGCIAAAAAGLRAAGASALSLGLAPLAGLDDASASPEERALARAAALVRRWYDVRGLAFFKGKFDPRWEPRYAAVGARAELPGFVLALLGLHLGGFRHAARALVPAPARPATRCPRAAAASGSPR